MSLEIGSNYKLMRILVKLEIPIVPSSPIFVEGADFKLPGFVLGPNRLAWEKLSAEEKYESIRDSKTDMDAI